MSSDGKGGPVRRPRVIERPRVPPGPLADLKALIYELYLQAGTPALDEIAARIAAEDDLAGAPGRDTINRIIGDVAMPPSQADVVAVATVLALASRWDPRGAAGRARDLWVAAWMESSRCPSAGILVSDVDPRQLGVHAAISVPGVPDDLLPEYVERDADAGIRARMADAAQRGGFVLLVGGSSVGKTRCAFEAVTTLLPGWWLVHPAGPGDVAALAATPASRTVVWLDELQRYLDGEHGLTAATLRALMSPPHPAVVIGTLWPDLYNTYTAAPIPGGPDSRGRERQLLDLATVVRVGPAFSAAERDRACAAAARDRRLKVALDSVGYGPTQTLAAAPQLVARWQDAETADPYAWAVMTAALDAARLGARAPLSAGFLRAAAPGYCTSQQQAEAQDNWFEQALAYATSKLHGAAAALSPAGSGMGQATDMGQVAGYTVADYLIQHASRERGRARVPASAWDAILSHVRDPADAARVADSARRRLLYQHAIQLCRHAAALGHQMGAEGLAGLLAKRGDLDGLRALAAKAPGAARPLAGLLAGRGDLDGLRALADAGNEHAARRLGGLLAKHGDLAGAAQTWPDKDDLPQLVVEMWIGMFEHELDLDELDDLARLAESDEMDGLGVLAAAGHRAATMRLAGWLIARGDFDVVQRILDALGDASLQDADDRNATSWPAADVMAGLLASTVEKVLAWRDSSGKAAQVSRPRIAASAGAFQLVTELAAEGGNPAELHALANAGDAYAAWKLAELLAKRGDVEELHSMADVDTFAAWQLAELLAKRGDLDGLLARADASDGHAAWALARLLAERGNLRELRARIDAGDDHAAVGLARLLENQGRHEEAERLRRFGLNLDGSVAHA